MENCQRDQRQKIKNKSTLKAISEAERHYHFKNLLGNIPDISDTEVKQIIEHPLDIKLGVFTNAELEVALKKHQNWKSSGT